METDFLPDDEGMPREARKKYIHVVTQCGTKPEALPKAPAAHKRTPHIAHTAHADLGVCVLRCLKQAYAVVAKRRV